MNDLKFIECHHPNWELIFAVGIEKMKFKHYVVGYPSSASIHPYFKWLPAEVIIQVSVRHRSRKCRIDRFPV